MHGSEDLALLELRFGALTYDRIVLCRSSTVWTVYSALRVHGNLVPKKWIIKLKKKKKKKGNIIPSLPFTSLPSHHTREYIPSSTQLSSWIPSFIRVIRYLVIKTLSYLYWLSTPYRVGSGGSLNIHRQVSHWPQLLPTDEWRARSPEYRP